MKVLIVGATGALGPRITRRALKKDHRVTVLVCDPAQVPLEHENLRIVAGDVLRIGAIDPAIAGQEAVICTFNAEARLAEAADNVIRAMRRHNTRRLIFVSETGGSEGEEPVCRSDRDWTVVRPARLTEDPARKRYEVILHSAGVSPHSISRADVAAFVVSQLPKTRYVYKIALLTD